VTELPTADSRRGARPGGPRCDPNSAVGADWV